MWRLLLCTIACIWAAAEAAELHCVHPQCVLDSLTGINHEFSVEGHKFYISVYERILYLKCGEKRLLNSPALPRFIKAMSVVEVTVDLCAPPIAGSFVNVLAELNVTLDTEAESKLLLERLPSEPPLTQQHFSGFTHLMNLGVLASESHPRPMPSTGFHKDLRNLRSLMLIRVQLPAGEQIDAPLLSSLTLTVDSIEQLPKTLLTLPNLRELVLREEVKKIGFLPERTVAILARNSIHLDKLSMLESLELVDWSEPQPSALTSCDELQKFTLVAPKAKVLPAHWVAACPHLRELVVESASYLVSLPPKLLEGASELSHLAFKEGVLETLPEGFFDATPNLHTIDFTGNRLHMLPSGVFTVLRTLHSLDLSRNQLEAVDAVAPLRSLNVLNISSNRHLGDLCDHDGDSPLRNLTKLRLLSLMHTNITRICRDWRSSMIVLPILNQECTKTSELSVVDVPEL